MKAPSPKAKARFLLIASIFLSLAGLAAFVLVFGRAIDRISHVGMMIDGQHFINATTYETPCVRIDDLKVERWQKIYQAARRPTVANVK